MLFFIAAFILSALLALCPSTSPLQHSDTFKSELMLGPSLHHCENWAF